MRKSIFWIIVSLIFGIFQVCMFMIANGSVLGLVLLMIWMVSVVVGLRIFSRPKYAKYHRFI